ncbi:hypothetical protein, partial [Klebsiella pneumoniae]|uniref:hypothetical protein n=1 Tax=Klebsiella pneumoniae TaxID=573 RepID=UPI0027316C65
MITHVSSNQTSKPYKPTQNSNTIKKKQKLTLTQSSLLTNPTNTVPNKIIKKNTNNYNKLLLHET